ncbi:LamG-like jellyroll fold domain-containing protein [Selenomonas sp. AB3002]|uniref:LamG-like jellyroll fold domain-containing protein n=1 Tax=Selenomonas sp. AB3002 TaxID=1392502 RepID=UPI0009072D5D
MELGGRPFTIDCIARVDSSSPNNARLFSIINPTNGYFLASVRKSANNSSLFNLWANSYADCSQDYGYNVDNTEPGINTRVHVALVYNPDTYGSASLYLCVNGKVGRLYNIPKYNRDEFDIVIGALPNGNQGLIGSIDEFRIYDGVDLWTSGSNFTPPDASFYNIIEFYPDVIRRAKIPASEWHYENIGEIDTLINTTTAVQLTDLPATKSRTGKAFYQTTQTKIFDVPASKEVWIKFDVYFDGVNRWRAYDISTGSGNATGITAQTDGRISFFNRSTNVYYWSNLAKINSLQTIILHMKADSTNGLIEAYTDNGGLLYAYTGEVNSGTNFGNLYLQSDGSGTFFSSIEISNSPLWFNETFLYLKFDAIRMPKIPATLWQYENAGTITDLINTNTAVQVDNLPQTQSKTGSAFYQTTENIALFDIATGTAEIWIKFDVYSQSYGWKILDYTNYQSNSAIVVGILALCNYTPGTVIRFVNYDGNSYGIIADVSMSVEIDDTLRTFICT